jgi:hypothetical protein
MALPAFANEEYVERGHFAPVPQLRAMRAPADHELALSPHHQQADRLFGSQMRLPRHRTDKLPLLARIGIMSIGAIMGWSVPIAVATILVR